MSWANQILSITDDIISCFNLSRIKGLVYLVFLITDYLLSGVVVLGPLRGSMPKRSCSSVASCASHTQHWEGTSRGVDFPYNKIKQTE